MTVHASPYTLIVSSILFFICAAAILAYIRDKHNW